MPELTKAVGLSKATIYRLMKADRFPKPVLMTDYRVGWKANDVKAWVEARPQSQT
jgi:prophage regulatory protein